MSVLDINSYPHIPKKRTERPAGEVLPLSWWQDCEEVDVVCICCVTRWRELVPLSMMGRPGWMGELTCPEPECGVVGMVVRG